MQTITAKGWLVLFVCALCPSLAFGATIAGFPFWVRPWIEEFGVPRATAMVAYTAGGLVMTVAGPLVGRAFSLVSIRTMAAAGGLVMAAGLALVALAPSFWVIVALLATAIPLGAAFFGQLPAQTLATRMFPGRAGLVNGVVVAGVALSGVIMAAIAPPLLAALEWRGAFVALGAGVALVGVPLAWFVYDDPAGRPVRPVGGGRRPAENARSLNVMRTPGFWMVLAAVLPVMIVLAPVAPTTVDMAHDLGLGTGAGAILVTALAMGKTVGAVGGGWLCDRLGLRRVYLGVCVGLLTAMGLLAIQPGFLLLVIALVLTGVSGAAAVPWMASTVLARFGPERFGAVLGLISPFMLVGSLYPILVGQIREATGSYRPAWLISATVILIGLSTLASRRNRSDAATRPSEAL